ncbi:cell division ATP-binding protein FtsE [Bifidobacterium mongoliense]|uniref:Cell division ATP-binding protein FtsE n=1 Tax=Bifidobacterium mongoliense DSM 21395 TaxID=1437603 RepID=A0A087BSW8_9BIFI|nr:cell division ATP-binding protein FtsE [Bifidobacterium mongoliense]KFI74118.1 cell division ATP-binding protein FtsE [Bifidobacterium mongoliense DSM 21395]
MALISLEQVSKIYAKGTRPALDRVSVSIDRGDFVFLVGASGSGKTTLLSLLLREEEATQGELRVAGNDLRRMTQRQVPQYRRSMGFVFQDYKLLNNKTVWQNVAFALEVIGTSRSTIKSLVPKVLETVGLVGKERNFPHELSGGEAQRVAIARAYVNHPQILLADEPTGNLDPTTSLGIMEVLDAINRTGTTVVMATHNEEIVNSMRKRVIELHNGRIVRDEPHGSYDSALFFPDAQVESNAQRVIGGADTGTAAGRAPSEAASLVVGSPMAGGSDGSPTRAAAPEVSAAHSTGAADPSGDVTGHDADATVVADAPVPASEHSDASTTHALDAVVQVIRSDAEGDDGIARLANSVHSGRTGRYGDVFQSAETTMTWGKGIEGLDDARSDGGTDGATDGATDGGTDDEPPAPPQESGAEPAEKATIPAPPAPPSAAERTDNRYHAGPGPEHDQGNARPTTDDAHDTMDAPAARSTEENN